MNQWVGEVQERETAWQEERQEVLQEVQRLKAEAGKMVAILAMEAEEENLSEEKKLSLGQEVYSLQLVVEMRTAEVRTLRQKLAQAEQQLDELEETKSKLQKATARLDDLQAQVNAKDRLEKQLSIEKSQLEMTVTSSNKAVERMSQNVEELQWRIRNNFDLPIVHHNCGRDEQPASLPACLPESPVMTRFRPSLPDIPRNNILLNFVNKEMLPGARGDEVHEGDTSDFDFSPLTPSGQRATVGSAVVPVTKEEKSEKKSEENDRLQEQRIEDNEGDACSLDEGLGDLSDGEPTECPTKTNLEESEKIDVAEKDLEHFTVREKEYQQYDTLEKDSEEVAICEVGCNKVDTIEKESREDLEKESEGHFITIEKEIKTLSTLDKQSQQLTLHEKESEEITLEKVATTLEKVATTFVVKSEEAPPLPEVDPPNINQTSAEEKARRPSRIPKMIRSSSPVNIVSNQEEQEKETDNDEKILKEENQKEKEERERAFSPERRPSRISFETPL